MARKKPKIQLGRPIPSQTGDLQQLFGGGDDVEQASGLQLFSLRLDAIQPDPNQPRRDFSQENLQELAESIRQDGVIQPIEVTETRPNQYMIVHGERRWRAAAIAGLDTIPAVVRRRNYDDLTRFVRQLVENIQREDLNDVDRAYGMVRLRDLMQAELDAEVAGGESSGKPHSRSVSWAKVSERLGFTRQRASQLIQLLDLPEEIKDAVREGEISERDTRILRGLKASQQRALYRALAADDVTNQEYIQIARYLKNEAPDSTVHEAIRVLHMPLPPPTEPAFDDRLDEESGWEDTAASFVPPEESGPGSTRVGNLDRLRYIRHHLAHIQLHGLSMSERRQVVGQLQRIQQEITAMLHNLE